jgi:hypothetical protein
MNINDTTKQMVEEFEKEVYQFINEYAELQKGRELGEDEINFSKMFVFATDINANWLPQIAPISYGIIDNQVYSFVPSDMDGIVCEPICMWD